MRTILLGLIVLTAYKILQNKNAKPEDKPQPKISLPAYHQLNIRLKGMQVVKLGTSIELAITARTMGHINSGHFYLMATNQANVLIAFS